MNHNEIKERLMQAENAEEVITIAKETGLALTAGQAENCSTRSIRAKQRVNWMKTS